MKGSFWRGGCELALALGTLIVALFYGSVFFVFGLPESITVEWPLVLLHVVLAAAPFGLLTLAGIKTKLPWLTAFGLTICVWCALFFSELASVRDQTGANIGMGWIMLISPFVIYGLALIVSKLTRAGP